MMVKKEQQTDLVDEAKGKQEEKAEEPKQTEEPTPQQDMPPSTNLPAKAPERRPSLQTSRNRSLSNSGHFLPEVRTFDEALKVAEWISKSNLCPPAYKGKATDIIIAAEFGAEVGLGLMAALQNIAVINGRPSIWGDAVTALVQSHPKCQNIRQWETGEPFNDDFTVHIESKRSDRTDPIETTFSVLDAKRAGLWDRNDVWKKYPRRMLRHRAANANFADNFADVLKGIMIAEVAQDMEPLEVSATVLPDAPAQTDGRKSWSREGAFAAGNAEGGTK